MKSILKQAYQNSRFNNSEIYKLIFNSFSENEYVRAEVVDNVNTPDFIIKKLSVDQNMLIAYYANKLLGIETKI